MAGLSATDIRKVLDFVGEAHGAGDLQELREFLPIGLSDLVRTDWASYNEVGIDGSVHVAVSVPEVPGELIADGRRSAHQTPLANRHARTRDGRAYRFSDVAVREELDDLELFQGFYRTLGIRHQIAFTLPPPPPPPHLVPPAPPAASDVRAGALAWRARLLRPRPRPAEPDAPAPDPGLPQRAGARAGKPADRSAAPRRGRERRGDRDRRDEPRLVRVARGRQAAESPRLAGGLGGAGVAARAGADGATVGPAARAERRRQPRGPQAAERQPRQLRRRVRAAARGSERHGAARARTEPARVRGAASARARAHDAGDRGRDGDQPSHRAQAHRAHPREARHTRPRAGDRHGAGGRAGSRRAVARARRLRLLAGALAAKEAALLVVLLQISSGPSSGVPPRSFRVRWRRSSRPPAAEGAQLRGSRSRARPHRRSGGPCRSRARCSSAPARRWPR